MSDTILADEDPRAAVDQQRHEQSGTEGLIEQLVRGTSWATQTELTEYEHGDV